MPVNKNKSSYLIPWWYPGIENSSSFGIKMHNIKPNDIIDVLFIFSVGGGNRKKKISTNLIKAIDLAVKKKSKIFGIVGRKDGYLAKKGNCVVVIPNIEKNLLTPLTEAYQAVVWHFLVSHPDLQENKTKW